MVKRAFTKAEDDRLVAAIRAAEKGSRGEVRVHVEQSCREGNALGRAKVLFRELRMGRTRADTAVLLYVSTGDRKAAVFAGNGIHGAADPAFWQSVTDAVAEGARAGDLAGGIARALERVGDLLREHAPGEDTAGNELPDVVTTD